MCIRNVSAYANYCILVPVCSYWCSISEWFANLEVVVAAAVGELHVEAHEAHLNAQAERQIGEHSQPPGALSASRVAPGAGRAEAGRTHVLKLAVQVLAEVQVTSAIYAN